MEWRLIFSIYRVLLFVENEVPSNKRASAQGLFMFMTNGVGAMWGGYTAGLVVDHFTEEWGD